LEREIEMADLNTGMGIFSFNFTGDHEEMDLVFIEQTFEAMAQDFSTQLEDLKH
jgi:hypothetical protein